LRWFANGYLIERLVSRFVIILKIGLVSICNCHHRLFLGREVSSGSVNLVFVFRGSFLKIILWTVFLTGLLVADFMGWNIFVCLSYHNKVVLVQFLLSLVILLMILSIHIFLCEIEIILGSSWTFLGRRESLMRCFRS
jgi:hypothetical protein